MSKRPCIGVNDQPRRLIMRCQRRSGRVRWSAGGAVAVLAAALLAGCGSSSHASPTPKAFASAIKYANCMRSHGVPDFPDPNSQGAFRIEPLTVKNGVTTPIADLTPSSPAYQSAQRVCGSFATAGLQVPPAEEEQEFKKSLKAAACMRANGIPNYPDPTMNDGSIDHNFNRDLNINSDSPAFLEAATKCGGTKQPGLIGPG